jgi:hypothetical protein
MSFWADIVSTGFATMLCRRPCSPLPLAPKLTGTHTVRVSSVPERSYVALPDIGCREQPTLEQYLAETAAAIGVQPHFKHFPGPSKTKSDDDSVGCWKSLLV